MTEEFGRTLKALRKARSLTQPELARQLQRSLLKTYSKGTISKWEHGKLRPSQEVIESLEDLFLPVRDGSLLKAAGYPQAAELVGRRSQNSESLAYQQAQAKHFEDLCRVVERWRDDLLERIIHPYPDVLLQFPMSFTSVDAEPGHHSKGSLHWEVARDGTVEVNFAVEYEILFKYLEDHLPSKQLWDDYLRLKQELAEAIRQASATSRSRAERPGIWAGRVADELDKALARRVFNGRCEVCPITQPEPEDGSLSH